MHDRDELCSEVGLNITSDMLDGRGDGVACSERGVNNYSEVFDLKIHKPCIRPWKGNHHQGND